MWSVNLVVRQAKFFYLQSKSTAGGVYVFVYLCVCPANSSNIPHHSVGSELLEYPVGMMTQWELLKLEVEKAG